MWQIKIHRLVLDEDFKKINKKNRSVILKTIYKKLSTSPKEYGAPLRYDLKGLWKLKISDYRVVKIGIRRDEEVYKQMIKRLKKI